MPTYFCKECGSSTQSTSNIPQFCSSCGESFSSELPIKPPTPKPIKAKLIEKRPRQIPKIVLDEDDVEYDTDIQTELTEGDSSTELDRLVEDALGEASLNGGDDEWSYQSSCGEGGTL